MGIQLTSSTKVTIPFFPCQMSISRRCMRCGIVYGLRGVFSSAFLILALCLFQPIATDQVGTGLSLTERSPISCNPWIREVWEWRLKWLLYVEESQWSATCPSVCTEATTHTAISFHYGGQLYRCCRLNTCSNCPNCTFVPCACVITSHWHIWKAVRWTRWKTRFYVTLLLTEGSRGVGYTICGSWLPCRRHSFRVLLLCMLTDCHGGLGHLGVFTFAEIISVKEVHFTKNVYLTALAKTDWQRAWSYLNLQ